MNEIYNGRNLYLAARARRHGWIDLSATPELGYVLWHMKTRKHVRIVGGTIRSEWR